MNCPAAGAPFWIVVVVLSAGWGLWARGEVETPALEPVPAGRAVSADKQFVVYADELRVRAGLIELAETVKTDYQSLLLRSPDWVFPIVLQVRKAEGPGGSGPPVRERLFQTNDGYRLQLDVDLGERFRSEALRDALIRMLMTEQALRVLEGKPPATMIPRWLAVGVPEAMRYRAQGEPSTLFASIFKAGRILSVEEILGSTEAPANAVSEAVYRASACGFVQLLLDQASGPAQLAELIGGLGLPAESMADRVARQFPGLRGSNEKLEKWWVLQASFLARPGVFELMGPQETDRAIEEALQLHFWEEIPREELALATGLPGGAEASGARAAAGGGRDRLRLAFWKKREKESSADAGGATEETRASMQTEPEPRTRAVSCHVREIERYIAREDRARILLPSRRRLTELTFRSFPMHRAMLEDYRKLLDSLAKGRTADAGAKLESLEWERRALLEQIGEIRDYLNWYSVTQTDDRSGVFERYLERSRALQETRPLRKDRISSYLDGMEEELRMR
ncbi:MAG TPA: hypothetical protein VMN36_10930 [Verrucomicrobiales bacterium]|nr:hypothetical protein [Verrucomicrobiales bacterium]